MCNNTRSFQIKRDPSPMPNVHKALMFKYEVNQVNKPPKQRSSRPSLEDDLKKVSSSPLLGSDIHNKENLPDILSPLKVRKLSCQNNDLKSAGLSPRDGETVFRFSSSQYSPQFSKPSANTRIPRISVRQCEDDVFDPSYTPLSVPESSKLVLTPSTAHTPKFRYSSSWNAWISSTRVPERQATKYGMGYLQSRHTNVVARCKRGSIQWAAPAGRYVQSRICGS